MLYDLYYNYTPAVEYVPEAGGQVIDRFNSNSPLITFGVFRRLSHVSDIGWSQGAVYTDFGNNFYYPTFWPKEALGVKWEPRDVWVLGVKRVPSKMAGYCYGKKIFYIDKEFYTSLEVDSFDPEMRLWKVFIGFRTAIPVPGGGVFATSAGENNVYDLQNQHASIGWQTKVSLNSNAPRTYYDVARHALPAGLQQIMQ